MTVDVDSLERRVTALESELRGEQGLTRRLFEHVREIRDDIAVLRRHAAATGDEIEQIKTRLGRLETEVSALKTEVSGLKTEVGGLKTEVGGLKTEMSAFRREFPGIVADVVREVLKERRS
jgi:predicted RNase H-like nuclease (RuvC/YqgF family)